MKKNIAIFVSGNGTNAENIVRHFQGNSEICVKFIVSNVKKAFALERAKSLNIPCAYFSKEFWGDGNAIIAFLKSQSIDLIVLAGFMAHIPDSIVNAYEGRMVNIHPSLLPKFGGKGMHGDNVHDAVLKAGEKESGITIHFVNNEYDAGNIVAQYHCNVEKTDTIDSLAQRVHGLEYKYYPIVIEKLLTDIK